MSFESKAAFLRSLQAAEADPTAIPIQCDPQQQRMRGQAVHGGTYFDVPYMTEVAENLWHGGCMNGLVLPFHIKHLVSLYPWESYTVNHELLSSFSVKMFDSLEQSFDQIDAIASWVNVARQTGPVLVHCQAGLNRSSLVVGAALVNEGYSGPDAVTLIREKRSGACLCNPAFEKYVLELDS